MTEGQIAAPELLDRHWIESGLAELFTQVTARESALSGKRVVPIEPVQRDLARLHYLVRSRRFLTTLEFGVGYSTLAIAHALNLNSRDFEVAKITKKLRNTRLFRHVAVDANRHWLDRTVELVPDQLKPFVTFEFSDVQAGLYDGQLSHTYSNIPNVIADFIYLDGPDPQDVKGSVNGLDFSVPERTVMSADLLIMESCFLPGTTFLIDGRSNNARFLERSLRRKYNVTWDKDGDCTLFELDEPRLGPHNVLGADLF